TLFRSETPGAHSDDPANNPTSESPHVRARCAESQGRQNACGAFGCPQWPRSPCHPPRNQTPIASRPSCTLPAGPKPNAPPPDHGFPRSSRVASQSPTCDHDWSTSGSPTTTTQTETTPDAAPTESSRHAHPSTNP